MISKTLTNGKSNSGNLFGREGLLACCRRVRNEWVTKLQEPTTIGSSVAMRKLDCSLLLSPMFACNVLCLGETDHFSLPLYLLAALMGRVKRFNHNTDNGTAVIVFVMLLMPSTDDLSKASPTVVPATNAVKRPCTDDPTRLKFVTSR